MHDRERIAVRRAVPLLATLLVATGPAHQPAARADIAGVVANAVPADGVPELRFAELFDPPGRYGLRYSTRARGLDGQRVRILGYMARQDEPVPGAFLLAALPIVLHEHEYGLADDLPPASVHVFVPEERDRPVPWTPGLLLLTGTLDLGPREEPDGRISAVRLLLDPPVPPEAAVCAAADAARHHHGRNAR